MRSTLNIAIMMLLIAPLTLYSQEKIGFTIQKLYMQGYEAKAMGTVTFFKSFTEMEIKQCIIPDDGNPIKNPKYEIKRYKLDGKRLDGEGIKEFENMDIVFCGTAMSENEPNMNITTFLDKDSCSLVIPEFGYEATGMLIKNKNFINPGNNAK